MIQAYPRRPWPIAQALVVLITAAAASADEKDAAAPAAAALLQGNAGIARRFPGDAGIEKAPAVVFAEEFEAGTMAEVRKRWESVEGAEGLSLSDDVPALTGGKRSLLVVHKGGSGSGSHLYRRLDPGHDRLHVRFYVKFDPDCAPVHHFFHLGGYNPPTPWPQGGAGQRPRGDERFSVGIEPFGSAWAWDSYSYWCEMRASPPRGQSWGNRFAPDNRLKVARGAWTCVETMVALNDPADTNGELALWIDGKLESQVGKGFPSGKWDFDKFHPGAGGEGVRWSDAKGGPERFAVPAGGEPFAGMRWRNDARLQINFLWVLLYITRAPPGHESKVWFDHIVAAKEYIGPLSRPDGR